MKHYRLPYITYEEFLKDKIMPKYEGCTCAAFDCTKPAKYEGGDGRYQCGMCEEHAGMREQYKHYLEFRESKFGRYGLEGRDD